MTFQRNERHQISQLLTRQILKSCTTKISQRHESTGHVISIRKIHPKLLRKPWHLHRATKDNKASKCRQMGTYLTETEVVYKGLSVLLHSSAEVAKGWRSCGGGELGEHRPWGWFCWVPPHCWDAQAALGATWVAVGWLVLHSPCNKHSRSHSLWETGGHMGRMACPVRLFHLAVPELQPFVINQ